MKNIEEFYAEVVGNDALKAAFAKAVEDNALEAFLADQGVVGTLEEFSEYCKKMAEDAGMLTEDELAGVSGGMLLRSNRFEPDGSLGECGRPYPTSFIGDGAMAKKPYFCFIG